jgi:PPOX class probable F420-dependent enzyme
MFDPAERRSLETARVGRLATADARGRPNVVPACFALDGNDVVTPVDEKPKNPRSGPLRRIRDVPENPFVALVVDHYAADWDRLGWVQVRGTATVVEPTADGHDAAVSALREKYEQYESHALADRSVIRVAVGHVLSWGRLPLRASGPGEG